MGAHGRGQKLLRIGQHPPLYFQLLVFFLPDRRTLDFVLLKTPQVSLAQACLLIALKALQAGTRLRPLVKRSRHPVSVDTRAAVQQLALLCLVKATHGLALRMHQGQLRGELAQHVDRGRLIVHVDAALAPGLYLAPQNDLCAFGIDAVGLERILRPQRALKNTGHDGTVSAMPHHIGGGLVAHEQRQRVDQYGLTRPGLSRQQVEARAEDSNRMINDGVVFSAEFEQHGAVSRVERSIARQRLWLGRAGYSPGYLAAASYMQFGFACA